MKQVFLTMNYKFLMCRGIDRTKEKINTYLQYYRGFKPHFSAGTLLQLTFKVEKVFQGFFQMII
jgi:hypothetical protein